MGQARPPAHTCLAWTVLWFVKLLASDTQSPLDCAHGYIELAGDFTGRVAQDLVEYEQLQLLVVEDLQNPTNFRSLVPTGPGLVRNVNERLRGPSALSKRGPGDSAGDARQPLAITMPCVVVGEAANEHDEDILLGIVEGIRCDAHIAQASANEFTLLANYYGEI